MIFHQQQKQHDLHPVRDALYAFPASPDFLTRGDRMDTSVNLRKIELNHSNNKQSKYKILSKLFKKVGDLCQVIELEKPKNADFHYMENSKNT